MLLTRAILFEHWSIGIQKKKRYPQYNHTAVIVAEDITSRFQNVISLFNNQIPLIALQLSATKTDDGSVALAFIKVMDRVELGTDEEDYSEPTDRAWWEKKSTKKILQLMDAMFAELDEKKEGYELKYNKFYVGLAKDGVAKNFVSYVPKKAFVNMRINCDSNPDITESLEQAGLDVGYSKRYARYHIKISKIEELTKNKEAILQLVDSAKERMGID